MQVRQKPQFNFRELLILENDEELDQNLLCQLCQELVLEPQECQECQNLFCHKCIQTWLQQKNQCVFKCPSQPPKIKDPHKMVKTALGALKFACPNSQKGCNKRLNQQKIMAHMNECEMASLNCPNKGCNFVGLKSDMEKHVSQCMFIQMKYQNCFQLLNVQEQQTHNCFHELFKTINELRKENNQLRQEHQSIRDEQQEQTDQIQEKIVEMFKKVLSLEETKSEEKTKKPLQNKQTNQKKPKCNRNHVLSWTEAQSDLCFGCKKGFQYIHYECEKCDQRYCAACKPPLIVNGFCPGEHQFKEIKQVCITIKFNSSFYKGQMKDVCSICRKNQRTYQLYQDVYCRLELCLDCYKKQSQD